MTIKEKIDKRHESNMAILKHLTALAESNPDLRFGQLLAITEVIRYKRNTYDETSVVVDPFSEESVDTLKRMENAFIKVL